MKIWVITGTDYEGVIVVDGDRSLDSVIDGYMAMYDEEDIERYENSAVAGDQFVVIERKEVE